MGKCPNGRRGLAGMIRSQSGLRYAPFMIGILLVLGICPFLEPKHLKEPSTVARSAVCIAGAHRSGTSMLTRLLHACGLHLGPKDQLMSPQADNPEGFWEHLGFVALNDQLLSELGGAWDLPPKADEDFTS